MPKPYRTFAPYPQNKERLKKSLKIFKKRFGDYKKGSYLARANKDKRIV